MEGMMARRADSCPGGLPEIAKRLSTPNLNKESILQNLKVAGATIAGADASSPKHGDPVQGFQFSAYDLSLGDDSLIDDVSLEGLEEELEHFQGQEVVSSILGQGSELREFARDVEEKLRQVELESIQDYIKESDNLVLLHTQIRECDSILGRMEELLGGFQADLGAISSEIKNLQEQSMSMGIKLRNRKEVEGKLAKFLEDIVLSPELIDNIFEGEMNEGYLKSLETLSRKLIFTYEHPTARTASSLKDVEPELEKLRVKAVAKSREFLLQKLYALRKPKTNVQILQQNVLLRHKYLATFLREHGKEVYPEIRNAYVDTMGKVLCAHFKTYIQALMKVQLDLVSKNDLIAAEDLKPGGLFSRVTSKEVLKNRSAVFSLGDRAAVLKEIDQPAIIPHIAEGSGQRYPYEVLFRSIHKLLMDTATSEYLFCYEFFGEDVTFYDIFSGPFVILNEHLQTVLPTCHDAIGLLLMIRMTHQHQLIMTRRRVPCLDSYFDKVNMLIWPRFKFVFEMHLTSVRSANPRSLWEDDIHPHYVTRRYAEFTSSLLQLNTGHGDGQLEVNLEKLRLAVDSLLVNLSRLFPKQKQQTIFLINNYDMVLAVLKEGGVESGKTVQSIEELLASSVTVFVEVELQEHFGKLINFVKTKGASGEEATSSTAANSAAVLVTITDVEPLVHDFAVRWKTAIEAMHKNVISYFSNFVRGMEILRAALTQLLLYYSRLLDCLKRIGGNSALGKDIVSIPSIMYEIKKYSRTF